MKVTDDIIYLLRNGGECESNARREECERPHLDLTVEQMSEQGGSVSMILLVREDFIAVR